MALIVAAVEAAAAQQLLSRIISSAVRPSATSDNVAGRRRTKGVTLILRASAQITRIELELIAARTSKATSL